MRVRVWVWVWVCCLWDVGVCVPVGMGVGVWGVCGDRRVRVIHAQGRWTLRDNVYSITVAELSTPRAGGHYLIMCTASLCQSYPRLGPADTA